MGIITDLIQKRSGVANPEKWLKDFFGGRDNHSGVTVNETTALYSTAVFACIRLLSDTLASLPCPVYKRLKPRGKERAQDYPLYKLIHTQANSIMPAFIWRETMMGHVLGWGNGYSEIEFDNRGYPAALWPLRPDRTRPERDKKTGEVYYITQIDGRDYKLPKKNVLHIPGLGFDGIKGYSPISLAKEAIGLSLATEEFGARYFGSGTHPGAVITRPAEAPDFESQEAIENFRKYLNDAYGGLGKSHRLMLLEEGMDIKNIGIPPEDSQFLQTRQFQVNEIARFYGVPPHLIGDLDRSTNNNIEHQGIEFVVYSLRPWLVRWESYMNLDLIPEEHQDMYFCEFLVDGLLRGDVKSRSEALQIQRRNGVINADDWAEIENRNPLPRGIGGVYIVEQNMQSLEYLAENPGGNQKPPGDESKSIKVNQNSLKKAYERLFFDAFDRIYKRETDGFEAGKDENWLEKHYKNIPDYMENSLFSLILSWNEAREKPANEEKTKAFLREFTQNYVKKSIETLKTSSEKWTHRINDSIKELMDYE